MFGSVPVKGIKMLSKDSIKITLVGVLLDEVVSSDFKTNTSYHNVVSKLTRVFGQHSSFVSNSENGELTFNWIGKTTACSFATVWDPKKRNYTGTILFQELRTVTEEREDF